MDLHDGITDDDTNVNNDDTGNVNTRPLPSLPVAGTGAQRQRTGGASLSEEQLASITRSVTAAVIEVMASQGDARPTGAGAQQPRAEDPVAGEANNGDAPRDAEIVIPNTGGSPRERARNLPESGRPDTKQPARSRDGAWSDIARRFDDMELALEQYPLNPYFRSARVARRSGGVDTPESFNLASLDNTHPVVLVGGRQRGRDQAKSTAGARNLAEFIAAYPVVSYGFDLREYMREAILAFAPADEQDWARAAFGEEGEGVSLLGAFVHAYRCFEAIYAIAEDRITYVENRLRAHDPESSSGERALYAHEAEQYEEVHRLDGLSNPEMRRKMKAFMSSREVAMYKQLAKGEAERRLPAQRGRTRDEKNPDAAKRTGGSQ